MPKTTFLMLSALFILSTLAVHAGAQADCSDYSYVGFYGWGAPAYPGDPGTVSGFVEHISGGHSIDAELQGSCEYSGDGVSRYCSIFSQAYYPGSYGSYEVGTLTNLLKYHKITAAFNGGAAQSNGAQVSTQETGAAAADSCYIGLGCNVNISFSASTTGVGVTVTFSPTNLNFTPTTGLLTTCTQEPDPQYKNCLSPTKGGSEQTCGPSPILVDTTGRGFHLTSAEDGVWFDIMANGKPIKMAWTAPDSGNAFLALDRNHNGRIDGGNELFGDFTPQAESDQPNGYLALAEFDKPENGGNGDGIIDKRDWVYSQLLLCIDAEHTGILRVGKGKECRPLGDFGVFSIGLRYQEDRRADKFGNHFRYRGVLNPDPADGSSSRDGRTTYDVFFATPHASAKKDQLKLKTQKAME